MLPLLGSDCGIAACPMVVAVCVVFAFAAVETARIKRELRKRQVKVFFYFKLLVVKIPENSNSTMYLSCPTWSRGITGVVMAPCLQPPERRCSWETWAHSGSLTWRPILVVRE